MIRDSKFVKIIDFGKCTMQNAPLKYNIKPGSERQKQCNKYHLHLAYELRNIPHSKQSIYTDIYSVGYIFHLYLSKIIRHRNFDRIVSNMTIVNPQRRPTLDLVYRNINSLSL